MSDDLPRVSVIIPCRNEQAHIEACVRSVLDQDLPTGHIEFIVVDGMSDDGTREILQQIVEQDSRLSVVDNPRRITPCARNIGVRAARGEYVAILDAHTVYEPYYISTCIKLFEEHSEICCAGGPITSVGKGVFGRATAAAMSHPLGVGNAKHRFPDYEGYAEGACFPVFQKEVFEKVGLFDEDLVRNQDDEFNFRVARSGGKVFISPRARCTYYVRERPSELFGQFFQYGFYRVVVLRKHRLSISLRHFVPTLFFSAMVVFLVGGSLHGGWGLIVGSLLPAVYAFALVLAGLGIALKEGLLVGLMFPVAVCVIHVAYALGFASAVVKERAAR